MMLLPEDVQTQASLLLFAFCQMRVPDSIKDEHRLAFRIRTNTVTLDECTGPWQPRFPKSSRRPAAQFRYDSDSREWTLYWADRH